MVTNRPVFASGARGFTLVELMIGASLSAMIALGVITSFTFLGRNLVRLANNSDLQSRASIATVTLQKDLAKATAVTNAGATSFSFDMETCLLYTSPSPRDRG